MTPHEQRCGTCRHYSDSGQRFFGEPRGECRYQVPVHLIPNSALLDADDSVALLKWIILRPDGGRDCPVWEPKPCA